MRRFFVDMPLTINSHIQLPNTVFHHWCRVLRAKIGDTALLFNGLGGEYTATLTTIAKKSATVTINAHNPINRSPRYATTIGLVVSRGDRMDYAIQKATEMGVTHLQLLMSERSEVRLKPDHIQKKLNHWQEIAIAACEQCGMNLVPTIHAPIALTDWITCLTTQTEQAKLILAPNDNPIPLRQQLDITAFSLFYLLIGAEGGFTDAEINFANQNGFITWCLGERILRTETAPVVALAYLASLDENL